MYQTVSEFGRVQQSPTKQLAISEFDVKRPSLFRNLSPTKSKLPSIAASFGKEEEVDN